MENPRHQKRSAIDKILDTDFTAENFVAKSLMYAEKSRLRINSKHWKYISLKLQKWYLKIDDYQEVFIEQVLLDLRWWFSNKREKLLMF